MVSNKKVTGAALERILLANKQYIDSRDIGFEEIIDIDEVTGFTIPKITLCDHNNISANDLKNIINKNFGNKN